VFDAAGRVVYDLSRSMSNTALSGSVTWSGYDQSGRQVPAGVYFVRLESGGQQQAEKVILTQ